jgi:hypothetical protein
MYQTRRCLGRCRRLEQYIGCHHHHAASPNAAFNDGPRNTTFHNILDGGRGPLYRDISIDDERLHLLHREISLSVKPPGEMGGRFDRGYRISRGRRSGMISALGRPRRARSRWQDEVDSNQRLPLQNAKFSKYTSSADFALTRAVSKLRETSCCASINIIFPLRALKLLLRI